MSATKWKSMGGVRPYSPRNWSIPHVALCGEVRKCEPRPADSEELARLKAMVAELAARVDDALAAVE